MKRYCCALKSFQYSLPLLEMFQSYSPLSGWYIGEGRYIADNRMQTTNKWQFVKKSPDPPMSPTDLQLAASTPDTRPPTPTCTAWRVVWFSTCHRVLFHVVFHDHNHVPFHVLEQCRLLSPRLRAHNRSILARLCPVHLFSFQVCWAKACFISQCRPWPRHSGGIHTQDTTYQQVCSL